MPPPQHARARAVGLVTGPHARTPRTHSQWVVGPGRTPEQTRGGGWESARPRTAHTQARGAPPRHPHAAPTARTSARCGVGDGSPRPHPPHPQPVGSGAYTHTRALSTWQASPGSPPRGRAAVGGGAPDPRRPSQRRTAPPPRRPSASPTMRNAGPQGRAPWGRCWVPTPARTASGTHGSRNPGCPLQRTGGRGRDSA